MGTFNRLRDASRGWYGTPAYYQLRRRNFRGKAHVCIFALVAMLALREWTLAALVLVPLALYALFLWRDSRR